VIRKGGKALGERRNNLQQNETGKAPEGLSAAQATALDCLMLGATVTDAAQAAGVDRTTVHRWRSEPVFAAAFNSRLEELRAAAHARLERIAECAARTVEEAVASGDVKAALAVLRGVGLLRGAATALGPTDPERLRAEAELAEARQVEADLLNRTLYGLGLS
jgi:hypothetical protein